MIQVAHTTAYSSAAALQFGQDVQHSLETDLAALVQLLDEEV
ncbi:hypothetical protein [Agromyces sp. ISL-38]|nr:hypothetical protein [Agromyces sp. ISL-38]